MAARWRGILWTFARICALLGPHLQWGPSSGQFVFANPPFIWYLSVSASFFMALESFFLQRWGTTCSP
jgi:hypothetical protein